MEILLFLIYFIKSIRSQFDEFIPGEFEPDPPLLPSHGGPFNQLIKRPCNDHFEYSTILATCVLDCDAIKCGTNAECIIKDGQNGCSCLKDFFGDPYVKCIENPCSTMRCGENATCLIENDLVHCKCNDGLIGNPLDKCWKAGEDICKPNPCGKNSRCIKYPESKCICRSGYYGQPPNCREGCEKDFECESDQYCAPGNLCKFGCQSDANCKFDEYCEKSVGQKCMKGCKSDASCKQNEYCELFGNKCKSGCRSSSSCKKNETCDFKTKTCKQKCILNKDCNEGEFCDHIYNICTNPCIDEIFVCGKNAKCKSVGHSRKVHCSCVDGYEPQPGIGCVKIRESSGVTNFSQDGLDCSQFCAEYAECDLVDKKIECRCPDEILQQRNPFQACISNFTSSFGGSSIGPPASSSSAGFLGGSPSYSGCTDTFKPECTVPLSSCTIIALCG